jgi:ABC-2 type transport system ATP-binding protein
MDLDMKKRIDDLSFGNKKKVGIVQGLLHEPKLIILDEPTSGLDPLMQQKFFDLLLAENKKGATILLSSHVLSEVQRLCSRVAIIKDGKIIKLEKISDLTENNHKKFKIEMKEEIGKDYFELGGINNLEIEGRKVSFLFKGNINLIMKKLAGVEITNILIEEPSLEEIFIHYYEKEA